MPDLTYQDLANEAMIRWPHIDQPRMAEAILLAGSTRIYKELSQPGCYSVQSSDGCTYYKVSAPKHSCTCMDHRMGHICKHRLAIWLRMEYEQRTGQLAPRSSGQTIEELNAQLGFRFPKET